MLNRHKLDTIVTNNFENTKVRLLIPSILLLLFIAFMLFLEKSFSVDGYVKIQENVFFYLNSKLSELPNLQYNLTQLGDALILFPLLSIFIIYAPKLWGAILTSGLISLVISFLLKKIFAVPRPAAMFDNDSFVIVGKTLSGNTSLPSGHSITIFTITTLLLFAFMPKETKTKIVWSIFIPLLGLGIAFSRVGVGAHYPLDVIIGSTIGYITALLGIFINNKVHWWTWINNKKYYPIFMVLFTICGIAILKKIVDTNLAIYYFSIVAIVSTLYLMIKVYVKKEY